MVAGNGEAGHGGDPGATTLEERVRRLEKDVEDLRKQVRTRTQGQSGARAKKQIQAHAATRGEPAATTAGRPTQGEPVPSAFSEATRNPPRRDGGNARARETLFGLFPEGLPSATWWVARAGVVLLLVGVSFLLRMGVEQGWLTPAVRVAGGVAVGVALSAFGLLARASRPVYSQLLVGGGVVAFYLSAFGAWSVWQLVPYEAAFVFCVLTTAFAFVAAVRMDAEWLALLGVMGGYATPFMLLSPDANVPALISYSLLLLVGYLMVYVSRGWRPVYITAVFGMWMVLAVSDLGARSYTTSVEGVLPPDAAWSVSAGALVSWLTILFFTSVRRYLLANVRTSVSSGNGGSGGGAVTEAAATSVAPIVALFLAWRAWPAGDLLGVHLASLAGAMAIAHLAAYAIIANRAIQPGGRQGNAGRQAYGGGFGTSALAGLLENRPVETSREAERRPSEESGISLALRYARTQAFASAVLLTLGVVFLIDGIVLASALAVEGALLGYLVRPSQSRDAVIRLAGGRLIAVMSCLLLAYAALYSLVTVAWRVANPFGTTSVGDDAAHLPFLNGDAVSLLAVIASLFFVGWIGQEADAPRWRGVAICSRLLGHLVLTLGVLSEFARADFPGGVSFVFIALYTLVLALARFFSERGLLNTEGPHAPPWVASWLDVGVLLCVVEPWLWSRLAAAATWEGYYAHASVALSALGSHFVNLAGVLALFAVTGLLYLWGNGPRGSSTTWEQERVLPLAAVPLLATSTFFALYWMWTVLDPFSGGSALVSVAWGVLSVALLAGPALLLSPSSGDTGSAALVYWSSRAGYVVLALVVAKLFLYDLAAVAPILRILLFCGFGTAFVLAAYLFGGRSSRSGSNT
jgi:uncharacterized membrane protein